MYLSNLVETVVHLLLIGGMTCLEHWNEFLMVSVVVYVMHTRQTYGESWRKISLSWFAKLLYCMNPQPWEDIEFLLR